MMHRKSGLVWLAFSTLLGANTPTAAIAQTEIPLFSSGFESPCDSDANEPDTEAGAMFLGAIDDCDASIVRVVGGLSDSSDTDYFRLSVTDTTFCVADPVLATLPGGVRACLFLDCANGTEDVGCPAGSTAAQSPAGRPGCCTVGTSLSISSFNCVGAANTDAELFLRLDQAASCTVYDLSMHY